MVTIIVVVALAYALLIALLGIVALALWTVTAAGKFLLDGLAWVRRRWYARRHRPRNRT